MMKKGVIAVICLLFVLNVLITIIPETTKAFIPPLAELEWVEGQEIQWADVGPGATGLVNFSGIVKVESVCGPYIPIQVEVWGSTDQGWPVTVTPSFIEYYPWSSDEQPIIVTVAVPPWIRSNESGVLTVSGRAIIDSSDEPYNITPITGTINIKQYYRHLIVIERSSMQVKAGDKFDFNISIKNFGNCPSRFILKLNDAKIPKDIWLKSNINEYFDLTPRSSKNFYVKFETGIVCKPGKYEITLPILLDNGVTAVNSSNLSHTVIIFVKDNYFYPLTISFFIIGLVIIGVFVFKYMRIRNDYTRKFYRRRTQPNKPQPPLRIPPPSNDHVMW
jgi:hypothetical protein